MSSRIKYTVILTEPAEDDMEAIAHYTKMRWGQRQAVKYNQALTTDIFNIADAPAKGRHYYGVPEKFRGYQSGRHIIFYKVIEQTIYIIRILHDSMDHAAHMP